MSVSAAIHELLATDSVIASIVADEDVILDDDDDGVYPSAQPPQNRNPPYLIQEIQSSDRPKTLSGKVDIANYQIRIIGHATSEPQLRTLMDRVEHVLDAYKNGSIRGCHIQETNSDPDPSFPSQHQETHLYSVWYARELVRS